MEEAVEGFYTILNGDIVLTQGFVEFSAAANIEQYSIVVVKVEARAEAICLEFLEIY